MVEFDSDMDFVRELLGGFVENVKKQIERIRKGIQDGDAEVVRKEAHSIKGGSANICADDLSRVALEMEMLGKTGNVDNGQETLLRLENEFNRLNEYYTTI
jgi:HPt (histidine-containing phosphotransfer) domain-containing protein